MKLDVAAQRVVVHAGLELGAKWGDPATHGAAHVHQGRQRTWWHLDPCRCETVISVRVSSEKYACCEGAARKFFGDWLAQVTRSGPTAMKKVAEMSVRHLPSLLNYLKHRITNAASEDMNSQTARIIAKVRGISCFEKPPHACPLLAL